MHDLSEFRAVYLEELDEQLQMIEEEILRLENEGRTDAGIQRLFRAAHTIKGSSAAMGYERMKELTHELEHVLDKARNGELPVEGRLTDLFLICLDGMKSMQQDIISCNQERLEIASLVQLLRQYEAEAGQAGLAKADIEPEIGRMELQALLERAANGSSALWIYVKLSSLCEMKMARSALVEMGLRELGDVFWSDPLNSDSLSADGNDGEHQLKWLLCSALPATDIVRQIREMTDVDDASAEICDISCLKVVQQQEEPEGDKLPEAAATQDKSRTQTIRVNVDRLEQLMNLVGELVIDQTGLQRMEGEFRKKLGRDDMVSALGHLADRLTRTIGELQESVMKVRMLPIEQLFNRFPRMIRDLARNLNKDIELVIEGKETELDRTLIEEIGDPLIHLIRNAIDHGLEVPEERLRAGKSEKGTLRISAAHEDNQVVITVQDDGKGIDPERIRASAASKGIIGREAAAGLSDKEAIQLIFQPGFSTASVVSEVSGRGVGMDIVRTQIERLNGLIDIETRLGEGTCFRIRLPLTLAIITGLIVKAGERTFVQPMSNVAEIVRAEPGEIKQLNGQPVLVIRDQIIPVAWLHDLFHYEKPEAARRNIPLVIVGRAEKRLALAVDELVGNQEIVIKSLSSYIGKAEGISGATILGDGRVALILDAGGMIKLAGR